ncbi:MAG: hypothetical protein J6A53_05890 [Clostridia bacterium]|nr:hypothetical protein [Clostridia bacterium]
MDFILLNETPMENLYRNLTWKAFKYFCNHTGVLNTEKYNRVYNEIFNFFIERKKKQFCLESYSGEKLKQLAILEYATLLHDKKLTKEDMEEYVENFDKNKYLLVIRPKKPLD